MTTRILAIFFFSLVSFAANCPSSIETTKPSYSKPAKHAFPITTVKLTIEEQTKVKHITQKLDKIFSANQGRDLDYQFNKLPTEKENADNADQLPYGELFDESAAKLAKHVQLTDKSYLFDGGCGRARLILFLSMFTNTKTKGREFVKGRFDEGIKGHGNLDPATRALCTIEHGDMLKADLSGVTHAYFCSTCFSKELLRKMVELLLEQKTLLYIISLEELPPHPGIKMHSRLFLPVTWRIAGVDVFIYTRS